MRGAQNQLAVAQRNADNQQETLKITQARLEGGRGTELDTARARAQLNTTLATIPPLETAMARSIHRLGVLSGQQPTALAADLKQPAPLPPLPPLVAISNPETLLRRRPMPLPRGQEANRDDRRDKGRGARAGRGGQTMGGALRPLGRPW